MTIVTSPDFNELRQVLDFAQTRLEELQAHEDPTNWEIACVSKMRDWLEALENLDELSKLRLALMGIPNPSAEVPEVCGLITLSTGHLTKSAANWLDDGVTGTLIVYPKKEYGWFIWIGGFANEWHVLKDMLLPEQLEKVIAYALQLGCEWLCLDTAGPLVNGLEQFEW